MSTLKTILLPLLRERYPHGRYDDPDKAVIVAFDGPAEVRDLRVWDEGDEATVEIGKLTHTHFNGFDSFPRDPKVSGDEAARRVAAEVLRFLADFFAGRIVVWTEPGGVVSLGPVETMPPPDRRRSAFSWKGRLGP